MGKFLEIYNNLRMNHEKLENLYRPIIGKKDETVTTPNPLKKRKSRTSLVNSLNIQKRFNINSSQPLPKNWGGNIILPNSFDKANIILISKSGMDNTHKKGN